MGAPPNEDQIADLLSNPNIAQQMNEALNNPAVVDMMIQANPMLRDNPQAREMLNSPFFRSMMTNPDLLRAASALRRGGAGGPGAASAFPAPGATDNTPAGAPAAGAEGANNTPNQQNPFPGFGAFGVPPTTSGGGAANPFAALFNPAAAQPAAGGAPGPNAAANPLAGLFGAAPPGGAGGAGAAGNPFGITPEMMQQFMGMMGGSEGMGGMGGMGGFGAPAAPADTRPPEERYADQLRQLNEMGFFDFDQNVAALRRSGGNVQGAVNFLLGG